jgi:hypothetical protein
MAAKTYLVRFGTDNPATYSGLSPTFTKFFNSAGSATTPPSISEIASSGMYSFAYDPGGFIGFILDGTASLGSNIRYVAGALDPNDKISEIGGSLSAMGASIIAQGNTIGVIGFSMNVMGISLTAQGNTIAALGTFGTSLNAIGVSILAIGASLNAQGNTIAVIGGSMSVMGASLSAMGFTLTGIGNTVLGIGNTIFAIGASTSVLALASQIGTAADSFGTDTVDPTSLFGFMKRIQEIQEGDSNYAKGTGVWSIYNRGSSTLLRSKTIADAATTVTKL